VEAIRKVKSKKSKVTIIEYAECRENKYSEKLKNLKKERIWQLNC